MKFWNREGYTVDRGNPNLILEEVLQQGESSRCIQVVYNMQGTRCNKRIVMVTAISRKKINNYIKSRQGSSYFWNDN